MPAVRAVAKGIAARRPGFSREELVALVEALWAGPVYERRRVAVELLELCGDRLQPARYAVIPYWLIALRRGDRPVGATCR